MTGPDMVTVIREALSVPAPNQTRTDLPDLPDMRVRQETPMKQLDEIAARVDAATAGPWEALSVAAGGGTTSGVFQPIEGAKGTENYARPISGWMNSHRHGDSEDQAADAEFIAHTREDVPRLLAALRAVETVHQNEARNQWGSPSPVHDGHGGWCYHCGRYTGEGCATIMAIEGALNG